MLPSGNLQGISKSAGCKIRLWDLSTESGERPPYKDIENSEQSLAAFGPYALGGSYNEVHVVNLDSKTSICNRMEFHLPGADTGGRGRRRRGDLKSVTDVIGINSGTEALLEISDGSIVHFSNSDESKSAHQYLKILEPKLYQPWPVTPDVPVTRKLAISRIGQQGYLVIAASQYSQSSGRGKLILRGLSGSKPHDKESWGYWDPKIQTHHQTQISGLQQQPPRSVNVPTHPLPMTDTASVISWPSPISHTSFSVNTMSPPHQQQRSSMIMSLNNSNKKIKKQRREQMMIPTDDFHEHESKKLVQKYLHEAQKKAETKTKKSSRDNVMDNKTEKKKLKISIASKQALMSEEKKKKSSSSTQNPPMISTKTKSQQKKLDASSICEKEHDKMRRRSIIAKTKNSSEVSKEESFPLVKPPSAGKMNKSKVEKMDNNKHCKPSSIDGARKISDGEKPSHKKRRLSKSPQRERPVDASAGGTIGTADKLAKRRLLEEHKKKLSLPSIPKIRKCISDERIHKEKKTSALTSDSDVGMAEEKADKKLKAKSGNKKDRGEEKPTVFLRRSISGNGDNKRLKSPSRDRLQVKSQIAKKPEGESILKDKKTSKHNISSPIPTLARSKEKKSLSHGGRSKSPEPSHYKNDLTRNTSSTPSTNPSDPQQKSDCPKISTIIESNIQLYGDPSENTIAVLSLLSRSNNRNKNNSNNATTTESSVNPSIKYMEQRREMALQFRSAHNVLRQKFLSALSFVKTNFGDDCMLKKGHAQKVETTILDYENMKVSDKL